MALLVSGGHTQLVRVDAIGRYTLLGESLDDAAGEAFDKAAKMMGRGYPGGPVIAALATAGRPGRFRFPRPMTDRPGLDFSFSGLKTFTANTVRDLEPLTQQDAADVALAFQDAVVDTLVIKCRRALKATGIDELVVAGGVAANTDLREKMAASVPAVYYAPPELCTDNGAMIAFHRPRAARRWRGRTAGNLHPAPLADRRTGAYMKSYDRSARSAGHHRRFTNGNAAFRKRCW